MPEAMDAAMPGMLISPAERVRQRKYFLAIDEWRSCEKLLFFPGGRIKYAWDFVVMLCVVYSCMMVPYRLAFEAATGRVFWFEACTQLIFLIDVVANFNTAVLERERWIVYRPRIAQIYVSGWFWVDLPAAIPFEVIEHWLGTDHAEMDSLPMLRALRLVRLLRLLKVLRLADLIRHVEDQLHVNLKILRMANTVIIMLIFCHFLACIFYGVAVATADETSKSWVSTFDNGYAVEEGVPISDAYVIALFWAIGLVCGQNTNVTPENMPERTLSLFAYVATALFFAYTIAVVTDQLSSYVNDPTNKAMDDLMTFCRFHHIPNMPTVGSSGQTELGLETRLTTYYANFLATRSMVDEHDLLGKLTPSLRDEVMDHLLSSTVRKCPLLCPDYEEERLQAFQEAIYDGLKPLTYERSMGIVRKNARGEDLYFLMAGSVSAVSVAEGILSVQNNALFPIVEPGAFFGEQCLLGDIGEANEVDYLAVSKVDLLCISKRSLIGAMDAHLATEPEVRLTIARGLYSDIIRKAGLRLWGMRIVYAAKLEAMNAPSRSPACMPVSLIISRMHACRYAAKLEAMNGALKAMGVEKEHELPGKLGFAPSRYAAGSAPPPLTPRQAEAFDAWKATSEEYRTYSHNYVVCKAMQGQIWYLSVLFRRLKRRTAADEMPAVVGQAAVLEASFTKLDPAAAFLHGDTHAGGGAESVLAGGGRGGGAVSSSATLEHDVRRLDGKVDALAKQLAGMQASFDAQMKQMIELQRAALGGRRGLENRSTPRAAQRAEQRAEHRQQLAEEGFFWPQGSAGDETVDRPVRGAERSAHAAADAGPRSRPDNTAGAPSGSASSGWDA